MPSCTPVAMATTPTPRCVNTTLGGAVVEDDSPDAFVYIVVVLSFYALAMTILMVKYIRRENQEAQLSYYFHEFINRDKFSSPRYRNKEGVTAIKRTLSRFYQSMGLVEADKDAGDHDPAPRGHHQEDAGSQGYSDSGLGPEERLFRFSDSGLDLSSPRGSVQYGDSSPAVDGILRIDFSPEHQRNDDAGQDTAARQPLVSGLTDGVTRVPVTAHYMPQLPLVESAL